MAYCRLFPLVAPRRRNDIFIKWFGPGLLVVSFSELPLVAFHLLPICFPSYAQGEPAMPTLTKRTVDAAKPREERYFVWCGSLPGFGVRIYPSGRKVFVAQIRVGRGQRRVTIGTFGAFTVDQARSRAKAIIQAAADGRDPQREKQETRQAITVAELCEEYMQAARAGLVTTRFKAAKSPATVAIDQGRIGRHIIPTIGALRARDLRRADVQRMVDAIAAGKTATVAKTKARGKAIVTGGAGTAAKAVGLLGGICTWAQRRGLVPEGVNPAHGVEKAASKSKDRVLSADELRTLGRLLEGRATDLPAVVTALRLIALTGLRRDEACSLRWREIDELGQCLRLENTKTGRSVRPISKVAMDLLQSLPRQDGVEWVFPRADGKASADMKKRFSALFDAAGLSDARSHDLRRTFASVAADLGYGDATIAELLGHARRGVTERHYVRRSDPVLLAAADRVSRRIANAIGVPEETAEVVPLRA
jgi:integrase